MTDLAEKHAQGVAICDWCDAIEVCRQPYHPDTPAGEVNVCIECFGSHDTCTWDDFPLAPAEQAVVDAIRQALKEQAQARDKALVDAMQAVHGIMTGDPRFTLESLKAGLRSAILDDMMREDAEKGAL